MVPALDSLDHRIIGKLQRHTFVRIRRSHYRLGNQVGTIWKEDGPARIFIDYLLDLVTDIRSPVGLDIIRHDHITARLGSKHQQRRKHQQQFHYREVSNSLRKRRSFSK